MNLIKIDEVKFQRIRWKQEHGIFNGRNEITRKPFGRFVISFSLNPTNGETVVKIKNEDFSMFDTESKETSYLGAVEFVKKRFDFIDEVVKGLPQAIIEEAKKQYSLKIAEHVKRVIDITEMIEKRLRK